MSCWVVPTIAAEIWGVSIDQVLQRVRDGNLAYHVAAGFMFVDVAPPAPMVIERPPTFTALSEAEVEALREAEDDALDESQDEGGVDGDDADQDESQSPDDDEASVELGDWRAARRRVGLTRIPPYRSAKPQAA